MQFKDFGLDEPILQAVSHEGYTEPTPIQEKAIPHVLAGEDLQGCAQTGTGKTAAFALPILHRLITHPHPHKKESKKAEHPIRTLVITPTRELAQQIVESFETYGKFTDLRYTVVYGGVKQGPQAKALKQGVEILVATPGRLQDLMGQGLICLKSVEVFVLDEADRMLDMGFIDDIWRIVGELPRKRQTLFFSATMPFKIQTLANSILNNPVNVHVTPTIPAAETVTQKIYLVERRNKQDLLEFLLTDDEITKALVFSRTKLGADRVTLRLKRLNIRAEAIHSDRPQVVRQQALNNFKNGKTRVLVASDIAARGIDVDEISHVINYDLPDEPEVYVHRIGRTGRAGNEGQAMSFCSVDERLKLDEIEKLLNKPLEIVEDQPYASPLPLMKKEEKPMPTGIYSHRRPGRKRRF